MMVSRGSFPGILHCFRQLPGTPGEADESAPGIDVRKLQRSHSRDKSGRAFIRFTKPSFFRFTYPVYLSDLACSHQTLSDISLDRSEVKSDKLLDVNAALARIWIFSKKELLKFFRELFSKERSYHPSTTKIAR